MKNSKLFQYIVMGVFIFFIILGAILFSTYRSAKNNESMINITVWGTMPSDSFTSFVNTFLNDNDLKYVINYIPKNPDTFDQDLVEALASNIGPDAIILPDDLIVRYRNKIAAIPYTVLPELTFKQTFVQQGEMYLNSEGILALPFTIDPLVMYWNRDKFNNSGVTKPPTTWSEIAALVPKMTKKDQSKNILSSTVALGEYRNIVNAKEILEALIIQAGSPIVVINEDGAYESVLGDSFGLPEAPAELSLAYYTNFSNPSRPTYSWNRSLINSLDFFVNGDSAIYFGFASEFIKIRNKNPNLNFDIALLPQIADTKVNSTLGNMQGFAIMRNSRDPSGTYLAITALTSATAYPYWKDILNIPSARRDILIQPEATAVKSIFNKSAIMSKGWFDPKSSETNKIFQEMLESYTTGREGLSTVVSTASDRIDNLLK